MLYITGIIKHVASAGAYFTDTSMRGVHYNVDKSDKYRKPTGAKDSKLINGGN